ncbi:hypothetical protein A1351_08765 [Methylosinus sp. R-45379]|nr:hypothetical protein A1351_08765 [Methylosinus sp. R-45379]
MNHSALRATGMIQNVISDLVDRPLQSSQLITRKAFQRAQKLIYNLVDSLEVSISIVIANSRDMLA